MTQQQLVTVTLPVICIDNENVKKLVFSDVYHKYPIHCHAFLKDFADDARSKDAQFVLGMVSDISNGVATLIIKKQYLDKFNAIKKPVLSVLSIFNTVTKASTITKFRVMSEAHYLKNEEERKAQKAATKKKAAAPKGKNFKPVYRKKNAPIKPGVNGNNNRKFVAKKK